MHAVNLSAEARQPVSCAPILPTLLHPFHHCCTPCIPSKFTMLSAPSPPPCSYAEALEENWGKPPGNLNSNGQELLVYGKQFGNVFIGVQPTFG